MIDSHAHLDDEKFDLDREELINNLKENGIDRVYNIGADIISSENSVNLANKYDNIFAVVGVHPHEADSYDEKIEKRLDELDLSEIKRLKVTKYDNYYKYSQDYVKYGWIAIFEYIGKSDNISRYQLYISSYRNGGVEHYINMLFTTIEKMLIELDPDIELKKEVIKRKTKRSFF